MQKQTNKIKKENPLVQKTDNRIFFVSAIAIVAIVAIVGLVLSFSQNSPQTSFSEPTNNLVGQATRVAISVSNCTQNESGISIIKQGRQYTYKNSCSRGKAREYSCSMNGSYYLTTRNCTSCVNNICTTPITNCKEELAECYATCNTIPEAYRGLCRQDCDTLCTLYKDESKVNESQFFGNKSTTVVVANKINQNLFNKANVSFVNISNSTFKTVSNSSFNKVQNSTLSFIYNSSLTNLTNASLSFLYNSTFIQSKNSTFRFTTNNTFINTSNSSLYVLINSTINNASNIYVKTSKNSEFRSVKNSIINTTTNASIFDLRNSTVINAINVTVYRAQNSTFINATGRIDNCINCVFQNSTFMNGSRLVRVV